MCCVPTSPLGLSGSYCSQRISASRVAYKLGYAMPSITPHFTVLPSLLAVTFIDISGIQQPKTTYHTKPCLKQKQGQPCCADAVLFEDLASGRVDAVGLSTGRLTAEKQGVVSSEASRLTWELLQ